MSIPSPAAQPEKEPQRKGNAASFSVSPAILQAATEDGDAVLTTQETSKQGLTETEAERRLEKYGLNSVAQEGGFR